MCLNDFTPSVTANTVPFELHEERRCAARPLKVFPYLLSDSGRQPRVFERILEATAAVCLLPVPAGAPRLVCQAVLQPLKVEAAGRTLTV